MPILTAEQVARLCHQAGFSGKALVIAVAVARGESGFDTDAVGDVGLQDEVWAASHNIFQIRCLKAERGTGGARDEIANRDAAHNARAAWQISAHGTNFRPWSVFTHGLHRSHLPVVWPACAALDPTVPPLPYDESDRPVLGEGDVGPSVVELQLALARAGFACDPDGVFGAQTRNAVCAFQASRHLSADGVVGPETWAALGDRHGQNPVLRQGDTGPAVVDLQHRLTESGFPCTADGIFGPQTHNAVGAFQASRHLEVDGIVGPHTWAALGATPAGGE